MQNQLKQKPPEWTILKILEWTTSYFKSHHIDSPRSTAEILLAHVLKLKRIDLYLQFDKPLDKAELSFFKSLIKRRRNREPVAYITGHKEFWSIDLSVTKHSLIPRPETECLVETALSLMPEDLPDAARVLELGTGSGAITIALASERPGSIFFASDYSIDALMLARKNAVRNGPGAPIHFFSGDWLAPLKNNQLKFDIIISNPPYIKSAVIPGLEPEIWKYEPAKALDGGENGLVALKQILVNAHKYLKEKGSLLLETGHDQKDDLEGIIEECNAYEDIIFLKDYSGFYRIVSMKKKKD
ncbi:MAG: peptide chain release factor N(5)-glutamine methyltransferase [Deltaproteobacteria bacterium]|nr:peptide chain release factor N(5)-glutamine methyltransferase [Deltaproteobacteria bacterium]